MGLAYDFRASEDRERRRLEEFTACLLAFVGHELSNKLVALQGLARTLLDDPAAEDRPLLERLADLAQATDSTARRLAKMDRLLRAEPFGPALDLEEAVRVAAAMVNADRPASRLELEVAQPLGSAGLTRALLEAVLVQLMKNASQAGQPGQAVRVRVEAPGEGAGVWLNLHDSGKGMSEAQLVLLCKPFAAGRRLDATGPGLGFFLVRQAAARWGGAVRLDSQAGRGTSVSLYLPGAEGGGR